VKRWRTCTYRRRSDGTGPEELVLKTDGRLADVSRDGRLVVEQRRTCMVIAPDSQPVPKPIVDLGGTQFMDAANSAFAINCGRLGADSRLLAYCSDVSGRPEVYIVPFPEGVPRIQVSTDGGREPRWRKDGQELFYLSPNGAVMAVAVTADASSVRAQGAVSGRIVDEWTGPRLQRVA
jgi:hypothetical protein